MAPEFVEVKRDERLASIASSTSPSADETTERQPVSGGLVALVAVQFTPELLEVIIAPSTGAATNFLPSAEEATALQGRDGAPVSAQDNPESVEV